MSEKSIHYLTRWLNRILSLDPGLSHALSELSGKVIALEFINTDMLIYCAPNADGLHLSTEYAGTVHVRIRATLTDMLAQIISAREGDGHFAGSLEIIGDVGLAQRFQNIMQDIDLDWEEQLSHWLGDTIAHKLGRFARHGLNFLRQSRYTLEMNVSEYLLYEKEILPVETEVQDFIAAVDVLRNDVARMKMRIDRLQRRTTNES